MKGMLKKAGGLGTAYGLATASGFFYATAYFQHFNIDILDFVTPIDFLLMSLQHIDKLVLLGIVGLPAVFIWVAVILPLAVVLALVLIAISILLLLLITFGGFAILISIFALAAGFVQRLISAMYWGVTALTSMTPHQTGSDRDNEDDDTKRQQGIRTMIVAYKAAKAQGLISWQPIRPDTYTEITKQTLELANDFRSWAKQRKTDTRNHLVAGWKWLKNSYVDQKTTTETGAVEGQSGLDKVSGGQQAKRRSRVRPWQALDWRPRILVLCFAILVVGCMVLAAWRIGVVEAHSLGQRDQSENCVFDVFRGHFGIGCYSWKIVRPFAPPFSAGNSFEENQGSRMRVYGIPMTSLDSLEFSSCRTNPKDVRKDVRLKLRNLRHDAGNQMHGRLPECLVYVGAAGSMLFLADLPPMVAPRIEPTPPPILQQSTMVVVVDGQGEVEALPCKWSFVALVGPFETGKSDILKASEESITCPNAPRMVRKSDDVPTILDGKVAEKVILVGRTDMMPINNESFRSNVGLGQARADWVKKRLQGRGGTELNILSIPGGPANPNTKNACDRTVEVHICSAAADASGSPPWTPPT